MQLSKADSNLLVRVEKIVRAQANQLEKQHGANWAATAEARQAKRDHDRLRREAHDLAAMRQRLSKAPNPGA